MVLFSINDIEYHQRECPCGGSPTEGDALKALHELRANTLAPCPVCRKEFDLEFVELVHKGCTHWATGFIAVLGILRSRNKDGTLISIHEICARGKYVDAKLERVLGSEPKKMWSFLKDVKWRDQRVQ